MEIIWLSYRDFETRLRENSQSESPGHARIAHSLLELLTHLRREAMGPRLYASYHSDRELWLYYEAPNGARCTITVKMDWPDYGPLEEGLPRFHYRMTYQIESETDCRKRPLIEERSRSVESASEFVRQAILETRGLL